MSKLDELITQYCAAGVKTQTLEECCLILDNKRKPVTKAARVKGIYPYYGANGIQDYVSDYIFNGTFVLVGEDGSVITENGNPIVNWATGKIWVNNHAHIIAEKDGVLLRYLFYFLQTINISSLIHGSIPKFTGKDFKALPISIPPLPVQEEIVRILDAFHLKTIELNEKLQIELEKREKQNCLILDKTINNFTKNALTVTLSSICDMITVGIANSATQAYANSGIVMFRNQNIKKNYLDDNELIYIDEKFDNKYKNKRLKENDILITRTGYPGQACVVPKKYEGSQSFTTLIARLTDTKETLPYYICYYINSGYGKEYVSKMKTGAAQQNFGAKALADMPIILPERNIQEKVIYYYEELYAKYNALIKTISLEIELNQKQYEYYRNKLLTFPELIEPEA